MKKEDLRNKLTKKYNINFIKNEIEKTNQCINKIDNYILSLSTLKDLNNKVIINKTIMKQFHIEQLLYLNYEYNKVHPLLKK